MLVLAPLFLPTSCFLLSSHGKKVNVLCTYSGIEICTQVPQGAWVG